MTIDIKELSKEDLNKKIEAIKAERKSNRRKESL